MRSPRRRPGRRSCIYSILRAETVSCLTPTQDHDLPNSSWFNGKNMRDLASLVKAIAAPFFSINARDSATDVRELNKNQVLKR
jgi:hypothetical protein